MEPRITKKGTFAAWLFAGAFLVLAGAGCALPARVEKGTRAMVPKDLPILQGLVPEREDAWTVERTKDGKRRLESSWTSDADAREIIDWYVGEFSKRHMSTQTIAKDGVTRIFWGTAEQAYYADRSVNSSIAVHDAKKDGRTLVEMELYQPQQ
ncbi:MAG TPA: hypothetical protein VL426_04210 [Candidatus Binatia bacterium]|jgi:hypothetical protein|nr:hypothetical protein [Candidatus Binatia bacterium]